MNTKQNTNNAENKNNDWSKREIGALWKKDGPTQKYLSGYLTIDEFGAKTKVNVVVFSNKNKSKDTAPDFRVYLSKENVKTASLDTEVKSSVKNTKVQKTEVVEETEEVL
jgi:uncharacterized protein (DUF736 family)